MSHNQFIPTERTRIGRAKERGSHERELIYAILDEDKVAHVGFVVDGQPFVIPMAYGRVGDCLLLHGSAVSRLPSMPTNGADACITVTPVDEPVLARSTFHHSVNYHSVVALGRARLIHDERRKRQPPEALVEHLTPGRTKSTCCCDNGKANPPAWSPAEPGSG